MFGCILVCDIQYNTINEKLKKKKIVRLWVPFKHGVLYIPRLWFEFVYLHT